MKTKLLKLTAVGAALVASAATGHSQSSFSMAIVADNDYAVFGGTATGINDLLYQNNYSWPDQIPNLSTLTFNLPTGDTMFYVLGMGGGGQENIQGTVNGVDITTLGNVSMSSDISPSLAGYHNNISLVADGTFNASLSDVQTAFSSLTWSSPTIGGGNVTYLSGFEQGYVFDDSTAHLYAFNAVDVGVQAVPEPSTLALAGLGGLGLLWQFRRRK